MTFQSLKSLRKLTANERSDLVELYRGSGLTQVEFCKEHGLSLSSFKNWSYRGKPRRDKNPPEIKGYPGNGMAESMAADSPILFKAITVEDDSAIEDVLFVQNPPLDRPPLFGRTSERTIEAVSAFKAVRTSQPPLIRIDLSSFSIAVPKGFDNDTLTRILSILKAA